MTHLAPEVRMAIIFVFVALCTSSISSIALQRFRPNHDYSELRFRVRTWWVIVGLFIVSLAISEGMAICFLGFVSYLALKEFLSMVPTRRADRRVLFYAYLAVIGQYYFAATAWYELFLMFIPVLMFIWLPTRMWMIGHTDGFLRACGTLHWALMISVFSLSHAAFLLVFPIGDDPRLVPMFPSAIGKNHPGPGLLMFLILITELNDIFQFLAGKTLGKRRVAPNVSPGKTYAGFLGGLFGSIAVAGWIGPKLTFLDLPTSLTAGLIIALAGFAGDLCMSALKRDLKIKDFGATLPGHGGVLDRVDSLVFTAPLFFHFVSFCYG